MNSKQRRARARTPEGRAELMEASLEGRIIMSHRARYRAQQGFDGLTERIAEQYGVPSEMFVSPRTMEDVRKVFSERMNSRPGTISDVHNTVEIYKHMSIPEIVAAIRDRIPMGISVNVSTDAEKITVSLDSGTHVDTVEVAL